MKKLLFSILCLTVTGVNAGYENPEQRLEYPDGWISPQDKGELPAINEYPNEAGKLKVIISSGPVRLEEEPFFSATGSNQRACVTCHQPSDSMSLDAGTAQKVWQASKGKDPLFAAYDGSNCPTLPQGVVSSHSLLLEYGLFRIQMPWPPRPRYGKEVQPDFDLEVIRDPWGCNTGNVYGLQADKPNVSVYRRPRPVANLKYLTAVGFAYDPKQGVALPRDPQTGAFLSGNIMADNRALTIADQINDASATHMQMLEQMSAEQQESLKTFMLNVYAAQSEHTEGGKLDDGALGGPELLRDSEPGQLGSIGRAVWSEFSGWENISDSDAGSQSRQDYRESVARGARLFREKMFLITDSAGINSPMGFGNPVLNSCVFCHNMSQMGNDVAPGQVDLGTTNKPFAESAPHLPLFKITCKNKPHPHYGKEFYTQDPGFGLVTGRCADVGKITIQSMRGLSARAPYFANGSAKDLAEVVDFYDSRYDIGFTEQEREDLINLLEAL